MVTGLSSIMSSLVRLGSGGISTNVPTEAIMGVSYKSAPIVALYWLLKRLVTYWFMRDVFPTLQYRLISSTYDGDEANTTITYPLSPRIITYSSRPVSAFKVG